MVQEGRHQPPGQHPRVRIADQVGPPGNPNARRAVMKPVEDEAQSARVGGARRELWQDGVDETVVHAKGRPWSR